MARLRYLTAGESHGEMLVGILEGMPSGLSLIASRDIDPILAERQKGYGRGRRQQIEQDRARIISGVRFGITTGSPIGILIANKDWANWGERMSVLPTSGAVAKPVTIPRPGHADLAGGVKYGHEADLRNTFERASARETAMRVAIGAIASKLLQEVGISSTGFVRAIGDVTASDELAINSSEALKNQISESPVRTLDKASEAKMMHAIDSAKLLGDTLGGVVECQFFGLPVGLGSHVQWDRKLDGLISQAVMSTQAVKSIEIGNGIRSAMSRGSQVHDSIEITDGSITRGSNNAGGLEAGVTNGEPLVARAYMKPISTLMKPLGSVDLSRGEPTEAHIERSDVCAVPALSVIVENIIALTIADALLDTFGGDTMDELNERINSRRARFTELLKKR
jgi:chorismate synthase